MQMKELLKLANQELKLWQDHARRLGAERDELRAEVARLKTELEEQQESHENERREWGERD